MAEGEKNQDFTFKMESPSDSAVVLPSTPQASASPSSPYTDSSRKQPMSATLRERLRKTRSSFNSCYNVVKRLKVDSEENDQTFSDKPASSTEENCLEFQESFKHIDSEFEENTNLKNTLKDFSVCESQSLDSGSCSGLQNEFVNENLPKQRLNVEKAKLVKQVQEKEDLLRRLKLVKMYRSKNDLSQLQLLIKKWRSCSQLLLYELQSAVSEENKKLSLTQLIDHYGLDDKLLHYNRSEEEFIDV
ncbi:swi5-dependent recombination DNA repair protein 1 homolog isoform X2 [Piliocolobus tephrosceles]|uniref:Swi5-dependent recombination DNA repair protein 1 homolog n=1 Tax=Piliocolobus tephrosceles TaxID=591936 RepID=A0A8C9LR70_9PRIM|nr:swi5-dependent recombination DNA repair protein 1 homolog isoform X2 [Piliocolobus tephrosceles]